MNRDVTECLQSFLHFDITTEPSIRYEAVQRLRPTHLVLRERGSGSYHLISLDKIPAWALDSFDAAEPYLRMGADNRVPSFELDNPDRERPAQYVITDRGRVIGVIDQLMPGWHSGVMRSSNAPLLTRYLHASLPAQLGLETVASLLVSLRGHAEPDDKPFSTKLGSEIDVVILPQHGTQVVGPDTLTLIVDDAEESSPLQFKIRATALGTLRLHILIFERGQPLASLLVRAEVVGPEQLDPYLARRQDSAAVLSTSVHESAELSLLILEERHQGQPAISFRISALAPELRLNYKHFGPIILRRDPQSYFQQFFEGIEELVDTKKPRSSVIAEQLVRFGSQLYTQLFPEAVRSLLWSIRKQIKSILIQSEEPWIPWELCRLYGEENGRIQEDGFLCEQFAVSRWFLGTPFHTGLSLEKIGLIVPGDSKLTATQRERTFMNGLASETRHVDRIPARLLDVLEAFCRGEHTCWHFAGHGDFSQGESVESMIVLEHDEYLRPEDLCGTVSNLAFGRPLVFLNACCTGRMNYSLTSLGGWAESFVRAGAAAFVGGLYSVKDSVANTFAQEFYNHLLAGKTLGESAQLARIAVRRLGDPSWLSFVVYGHPAARLKLRPAPIHRPSA